MSVRAWVKQLGVAVALATLLTLPRLAAAHSPSTGRVTLDVDSRDGRELRGSVQLAIRDLDTALWLDRDQNGDVTWAELQSAEPAVRNYVAQRLQLGESSRCSVTWQALRVATLNDGNYATLPLLLHCALAPTELTVRYRLLFDIDAQHRGLVQWNTQTAIVRSPELIALSAGQSSSVPSFIREGVWHIWIGYDHILFLLCLILPAVYQRRTARWQPADSLGDATREVFEIVTAFTLAHSITLVISAIGLVSMPTRYVETAIALSVVAAAANNLWRAVDARWAVAFVLGLLHGFGFSSVLLATGLPAQHAVGPLLGFNIGVELGQAAIVVATLPLLFLIRRTLVYQVLLRGGSALVAVLALFWAYQRWCL